MKCKPQTLVIGIGNAYRSDDGAGLRVAALLKAHADERFVVIEQSGEGTALMEAWKDAARVILIDAARSGAEPGTIHRLDASTQEIPRDFFNYSTHAFSVAEAIELARALHRLPPYVVVYGIEGHNFALGTELSAEVSGAIEQVIARVLSDVQT